MFPHKRRSRIRIERIMNIRATINKLQCALIAKGEYMQDITDFLCDRKLDYKKRYNRAYEREKQARKLLENEPDKEDIKSDLNHFIKLQDRYNALIEFINELQEDYF